MKCGDLIISLMKSTFIVEEAAGKNIFLPAEKNYLIASSMLLMGFDNITLQLSIFNLR